jgi:hypothetical protein
MAMNNKSIETIIFFQDKTPTFLAAILPLLKPLKIDPNQFLFMKEDPANEGNLLESFTIITVLIKQCTLYKMDQWMEFCLLETILPSPEFALETC